MNHYPVLVFRVSQERETTSSPYVHDEFFRGQGQVGYKVSVRNEWLAILPYIRKSQRHIAPIHLLLLRFTCEHVFM